MKYAIKAPSHLVDLIVAASLLALSCAASSVNAADRPTPAEKPLEQVTYPVGYSDLDVSKVKGAKLLYLRIRYAAETLCRNAATWGKSEGEACVRNAINEAVVRVNVPMLTQYYELRSKGDKAGLMQLAKAQ